MMTPRPSLTPATVARRVGALLLLCLAPLSHAPGAEAAPGRQLAMFSRPSVVRIYDGCVGRYFWPKNRKIYPVQLVSSGSGFFINPDGYVATNAHVARLTHAGPEQARQELFLRFAAALAQDHDEDPAAVLNDARALEQIRAQAQLIEFEMVSLVTLQDGKRMPFEVKAFGEPRPGIAKDVAVLKIEVRNAPVLKVGDCDTVDLLDRVVVIGYPGAADTFQSGALASEAETIATVTDGSLSARKPGANGAPILQVSAPATHGNSGGPVLNDRGEVIGLLTFGGDRVNGQEIAGFTFAVSARTLMEFIRQAGVSNEEGLIEVPYRKGLELYWREDYAGAIERLEPVHRLFPHLVDAREVIRSSQQAIFQAQAEWRERFARREAEKAQQAAAMARAGR